MYNWDDMRYFLAVTRSSSLRAAAQSLGVSRSTVLRRISALESRLAVRLFDRKPTGYFTTSAGDELLLTANKMEELSLSAERKLAGRDSRLSGTIRIAIPATLLSGAITRELAAFAEHHPHIRLEFLTSYGMLDLFKGEADIAVRVSNSPPEELVGRRILSIARCCYVASDKAKNGLRSEDSKLIGWSASPKHSDWYTEAGFSSNEITAVIDDPVATVEAVRAGMGMAILPCFMGDTASGLCRVPPGIPLLSRDLWILTHRDLRKTARIRIFADFIAEAFAKNKDIYEGVSS